MCANNLCFPSKTLGTRGRAFPLDQDRTRATSVRYVCGWKLPIVSRLLYYEVCFEVNQLFTVVTLITVSPFRQTPSHSAINRQINQREYNRCTIDRGSPRHCPMQVYNAVAVCQHQRWSHLIFLDGKPRRGTEHNRQGHPDCTGSCCPLLR